MKKLLIIIATILSFTATAQTSEEIEMVNQINNLRTNPKSFIPYVENYIKEQESILNLFRNKAIKVNTVLTFDGKTFNGEEVFKYKINEAKKLIVVLKTTKTLGSLTFRNDMYLITKDYAIMLDSLKIFEHRETQKRFKPIGIYVSENLYKGNGDVIDCLISLLVDIGVKNYGHRLNLLNPNIKSISVSKSNKIWVQNFSTF
jgi:hypothetical protein